MKRYASIAGLVLGLSLSTAGAGQAQPKEQLGTVDFPSSCSAAAQPTFQRGVAMLHSFRYGEGERTDRKSVV